MVAVRDALIDRVEICSKQTGCCGFTVNRAGYREIKNAVNAFDMTVFGVRFWIIDHQKERVRAFWSGHDLAEYLRRHG